jgi:hypothetical protein
LAGYVKVLGKKRILLLWWSNSVGKVNTNLLFFKKLNETNKGIKENATKVEWVCKGELEAVMRRQIGNMIFKQ